MKRRLAPILTIGIALLLVSSLAYAADRRKQAKLMNPSADTIPEEEALKAELLDTVMDHDRKSDKPGDRTKSPDHPSGSRNEPAKPGGKHP